MTEINETDSLMVGKVYNKVNYGLLKIDTKLQTVEMSIKDINGSTVNSVFLNL
jgi:hypothetical protein